jgi:hypothetical protein
MVSEQKLKALHERKAILIAQCDLCRGIIDVEVARASGTLDWFARWRTSLDRLRPWIPLVAPFAGFLLARNWRTLLKWSGRGLSWRLIGRLLKL